MLIRSLAAVLAAVSLAGPLLAAEVKREPLYDIVGDFNKDGLPDRAVLIVVGPGNSDGSDLKKERYGLSDAEHVDLAIYLGAGNAPLDITKPASFERENIADQARGYRWVLQLKTNASGSLQVQTSIGWGSSNEEDETLTLQMKQRTLAVIGYDHGWERRDGAGACSIDLLKGVAERQEGIDGTKTRHFNIKVSPIPLKAWRKPLWPRICDS